MMTRLAIAATVTATLLGASSAEARKSPLSGAPDVRDKYELRLLRFEVAPSFEFTMRADYKHTVAGGLKLEYHVSDSLSFGGLIFFGTGLDTGLTKAIRESLPPTTMPGDPTPSQDQFDEHLNTMPMHGAVHATFTPWFGKLALFGKAYLAFDVYLSGGFGFASLKTNADKDYCDPVPDGQDAMGNDLFIDPRNDCPYNSGFKPGINMAAGMHVFFNKWIALDVSFRNYMFTDNPSGQDFDADRDVDESDPRFLSHLFFGVGLSLYLPPKVKITH